MLLRHYLSKSTNSKGAAICCGPFKVREAAVFSCLPILPQYPVESRSIVVSLLEGCIIYNTTKPKSRKPLVAPNKNLHKDVAGYTIFDHRQCRHSDVSVVLVLYICSMDR